VSSLTEAITALKSGRFVLVHDGTGRENEVDMVIAAQYIRPEHVARMRTDAGGLLCLAIPNQIATKLGLIYMHDMMKILGSTNPVLLKLTEGRAAYGDNPSFSISVNHRGTYTGISDFDRTLTISRMAEVCKNIDSGGVTEFGRNFRAPGHVPILIASRRLLEERMGHTELCIYLMQLAGLTPVTAICEMMDSTTYRALTIDKAADYSKKASIPVIEGDQLKSHAKVA